MKEIKLTQGKVALVDDEDFEYLNQWKWDATSSSDGNYYARRREMRRGITTQYLMHRVITKAPDGKVVDHIDRNTLNNQKSNLRICTIKQNLFNRKLQKGKRSKYYGVSIERAMNKKGIKMYIRAKITINGRRIALGTFKTEKDAALVYDIIATKLRGEYATLNFPEFWSPFQECNNNLVLNGDASA